MMGIRILGCGGSSGVPVIGEGWGHCDSSNPKNRRLRPSVLLSTGGSHILIDVSPDLREQLLTAHIDHIDAILITHDHADHLHGIDDLRKVNQKMGRPIDLYAHKDTLAVIQERFGYVFSPLSEKAKPFYYKPCLIPHSIDGKFVINGPQGPIKIIAFSQNHGYSTTLGFRIGKFAYSSDVVSLDEAAFRVLAGIEVWVVDCLRIAPHPTHAHLDRTLEWIGRVKPRRAILTHMSHHADYDHLRHLCPPGVEPAYDGMEIHL